MDWVGVGEEGQGKLLLAAWVGAAWTWSRSWDVAGGCNCNGHHLFFRHIQEGPMRTYMVMKLRCMFWRRDWL